VEVRHREVFDEYLKTAKALKPVPVPDEKTIMGEHPACVGEGTKAYEVRNVMFYSWPVASEMVDRMVRSGKVRREVTHQRGTLLYRK